MYETCADDKRFLRPVCNCFNWVSIPLVSSTSFSLQQTRALRITRSLGQAINLLRFSNRELTAFLAFQEAVNPHLALRPASDPPARGARADVPKPGNVSGSVPVDQLARPSDGLHEHVRSEIRLVLVSAAERSIAEHFIESLEPTGWLGRPVEDIARAAGCDQAAAHAVLGKLQQIDPPGVFARSLSECLRLDAEILTKELACLLDNLPMLARGEFDELAKICGCDRTAIAAHFAAIRGFNPKPGLAFGSDAVSTAAPDLIVALDNDGITVELNRSTLPAVVIEDGAGMGSADQRMLDAAKAVARAVERRNISTLQIATEIVRRQSEFFRKGPTALKPLTLREVAEATGVHESTVSRVTAGLRMDTPRGPTGLRDLLGSGLATKGGPVSAIAVQSLIREMIEAEDPAHPLSDARIKARLSDLGIEIARRTVAKYREKLRIPGTVERRAHAKLRRAEHRGAHGPR